VTLSLEAADIEKSNIPHDRILPTNYVLTSKDLAATPDEYSDI
jgi:hypothetical protein